MTPEEKLKICRKYFIIGCFALPFVWFVNVLWFFRDAFLRRNPPPPPKLRTYVGGSMIGFLIWLSVLIIWTCVYQTQRVNWGSAGIKISFVLPSGIP